MMDSSTIESESLPPTDIDAILEAAYSIKENMNHRHSIDIHGQRLSIFSASKPSITSPTASMPHSDPMSSRTALQHNALGHSYQHSNYQHKYHANRTGSSSELPLPSTTSPTLAAADKNDGHIIGRSILQLMTGSSARETNRPRSNTTDTNISPNQYKLYFGGHGSKSGSKAKLGERANVETTASNQGIGSSTTNPVCGISNDASSHHELTQSIEFAQGSLARTSPSMHPASKSSIASGTRSRPRGESDTTGNSSGYQRNSTKTPLIQDINQKTTPKTTDMDSFLSLSASAQMMSLSVVDESSRSMSLEMVSGDKASQDTNPTLSTQPVKNLNPTHPDQHVKTAPLNDTHMAPKVPDMNSHGVARLVSVKFPTTQIDVDQILQIGINDLQCEQAVNSVQVQVRDVDDILSISVDEMLNVDHNANVKLFPEKTEAKSNASKQIEKNLNVNMTEQVDQIAHSVRVGHVDSLPCLPLSELHRSLSDPAMNAPLSWLSRTQKQRQSIAGADCQPSMHIKLDKQSKDERRKSFISSLVSCDFRAGTAVFASGTMPRLNVRISEERLEEVPTAPSTTIPRTSSQPAPISINNKGAFASSGILSSLVSSKPHKESRHTPLQISTVQNEAVGETRASTVDVSLPSGGDVYDLLAVGESKLVDQSKIEVVGFFRTDHDQNHVLGDIDRVIGLAGGVDKNSQMDLSSRAGPEDGQPYNSSTTPVFKAFSFLHRRSVNISF
ncbi:hypothetical protein BDV3_006223 [Batrachochytrium dendrobatidis]